jgi:hypothetical protein
MDWMSGKDHYPPSDQTLIKTLILTVKDILHSLYGLLLHVGEDVRVGVEGYGDRGVPEHLLDDLRVYALGYKQGCAGVTEICPLYRVLVP